MKKYEIFNLFISVLFLNDLFIFISFHQLTFQKYLNTSSNSHLWKNKIILYNNFLIFFMQNYLYIVFHLFTGPHVCLTLFI